MTTDMPGPTGRTVCIVDDDPALLHALTFEMTTQGYTVLPFGDAEALMDGAEVPDNACLIVDHRLPRVDGLYLIEILRARGMTAPAILITTNPGPTLSARAGSIGVPIIEKPLLQDDLSIAVREALRL
jgi:two-component system, LuxR family, response regulator FixJ